MTASAVDSEEPIYRRIAQRIEADIASSRLPAGTRIDSERALAEQFGISRMTARQAMRALHAKGLVETRPGHGTFIARRMIEQKLAALTGFTEDMIRLSRRTSSHVVAASTQPAARAMADALNVALGTPVQHLERIRFADDEPVALEATAVLASLAPGLLDVADFASHSLYAVLREMYGVVPTSARQSLAATEATSELACKLRLPAGGAVLKLTRLTFDQHGVPFEFVRSHYRGDSFLMNAELNLNAPGMQ